MIGFDSTVLNRASFRGVPFHNSSSESVSGRRLTDHLYIDGGTETEDNGSKTKTFTIKAYVAGADYLSQKENLIKALDSEGSGTFLDTFYGSIEVFVSTYTVKEDVKSLGIANFDISFTKVSNQLQASIFENLSKSKDLQEAIEAEFKESYNPNIGSEALEDIGLTIKEEYSKTNKVIKFISGAKEQKEALQSAITQAILNTSSSINSSEDIIRDLAFITDIQDEYYLVGALAETDFRVSVNNLLDSLILLKNQNINTLGGTQKIQLQNKKAFVALKTITQIQSLNTVLEGIVFKTGNSIGEVKQQTIEIFEILSDFLVSQNSLNELSAYKSRYITFLVQNFSSLQPLQYLEQVSTTNVYSFSLDRYTDITRVDEIIQNNDILDPIFIKDTIGVLEK